MIRSAALLLGAGLVLSVACGVLESRDVAEEAVDRFHQLFNEGSYSVIYFEADPLFHRSHTVPSFSALMLAVRRDLGTLRQSRRTSFRRDIGADGTVATLTYESDFADGQAREEFQYAVRAGEAYLVSYAISSPLLRIR